MKLNPAIVEEVAAKLYIQALKMLPDDIKTGFRNLIDSETSDRAQTTLRSMTTNIEVAEDTDNLLCQDTGLPIYNITIGSDVFFDGPAIKRAIERGCRNATREHPLRSSVVHPITRENSHTNTGQRVPVLNFEFDGVKERVIIQMIPKGSGSENGSWLRMCLPADGVNAVKEFVIDRVLEAGGKVCPPIIVGVGIGGTSDLCMHLAKIAATRSLGTHCEDSEGAKLEMELGSAVNSLGIGPQGLGGNATAFAVHVETAATHITLNPVAVNIQCHSARRATATLSADGIVYGF